MAPEIGQRQLYAFAREQAHDDFAEWVERVKCRLVAKGFAYPDPERLGLVVLRLARQREGALTAEPSPDARAPARASPWKIPRARLDRGTFTPALGAPGALVETLATYHPEALVALKRAAQAPEVRAAIARARAWRRESRGQPVLEPTSPAVRELQARVLAARAAVAARKASEPHDDAQRDVRGPRHPAAEGLDQGLRPEVLGGGRGSRRPGAAGDRHRR
jgi:hypothetical protein